MNLFDTLRIIIIVFIVIGIIVNYNSGNMFGTNLICIGIMFDICIRWFERNGMNELVCSWN